MKARKSIKAMNGNTSDNPTDKDLADAATKLEAIATSIVARQKALTPAQRQALAKTFALRANALEDGSCGAAQCGLKLGGGPQAFIRFELAPDQKNVASIKSGQSVIVTCTPVYEPKVMWLGKGCTVK